MMFLLYTERFNSRSFHDHISLTVNKINSPPNAPNIDGPSSGRIKVQQNYTFNAVDPDGNQVKYIIDWGDSEIETTDMSPSGNNLTVTHVWSGTGDYVIKVYAQDEDGLDGPITTKQVTMPRKIFISLNTLMTKILERFPLLERIMSSR
jgi:hypothetical protein